MIRSVGTDLTIKNLMPPEISPVPLLAIYGARLTNLRFRTSDAPITVSSARLVYWTQGFIWSINSDGTEPQLIYTFPRGIPGGTPALSRDGSRVAFSQDKDIYTIRVDGSDFRQLTNTATSEASPTWSPDGEWIAFWSNRTGGGDIYKMKSDDGSQVTRLTNNTEEDKDPAWSPLGDRIAWSSKQENNGADIWVMDAVDADLDGNGDNPQQLNDTSAIEGDPTWSPDGEWIACVQDGALVKMRASGADLTTVRYTGEAVGDPAWSLDSNRIAFGEDRDLYVIDVESLNVTRITDSEAQESSLSWSPSSSFVVPMDRYLIGSSGAATFVSTNWSGAFLAADTKLWNAVVFRTEEHAAVEITPLFPSRTSARVIQVDLRVTSPTNKITIMQQDNGPVLPPTQLINWYGLNPVYPFRGSRRLLLTFGVDTGELLAMMQVE